MSDHLATEIKIGGGVPARVVPKLIDLVRSERLVVGWEEEPFTANTAADLLELARASKQPGVLHLVNNEAAWGQFEELEAFLCRHAIAFDRRTEGKYQYDAELVQFRPRMTEPHEQMINQDGHPIVRTSLLLPVREALEIRQFKEALVKIRRLLGPVIPALEPLRIVQQIKRSIPSARSAQTNRK